MPARILVIEDNSDNLELMSYLLTAFGHTVLKAMDGVEGLQLARRDKPDLVLCDLQMRKLDGFEVVRPARQEPELSDVRIVAVTAYAMREDQDKVMAAGFDGYITKPIVPEEFASRAEEFLRADLRSGTQPRASVAQKPQSVPRPLGARATILAVDDRQVNLSLIRSILEPSGYEVIAVETVSKAIQFRSAEPTRRHFVRSAHSGDERVPVPRKRKEGSGFERRPVHPDVLQRSGSGSFG